MLRATWVIAALLAVAAEPSVEQLMLMVDPAADDWVAEAAQSEASKRLDRLAGALQQGAPLGPAEGGIFVQSARATPLRPESLLRQRVAGGLEIARPAEPGAAGEPSLPVAAALAALVAPLREARPPRFSFTIVGVEALAGAPLTTRVRYEAAGQLAAKVVQQTAFWRVGWSGTGEELRVATIQLLEFEEVSRPAFMFTDSTNAVLPNVEACNNLRFGGDFWHGRIDAVGESNRMGHQGIAVGDFDGDGLEDLYVAMGTGLPNLLLVQGADGTVRDVAEQAGVAWLDDTKGVLFADTDNDGDQDLLMAIGPTVVLAKNGGNGNFERFVSMRASTPAAFYSLSAADYDLDGDLDIYGTRYVHTAYGVSIPLPFHDAENGPTNHLLRNDGEDRFTDVTAAVGLNTHNTRFSLAGAWNDYDLDGDPDLYVANDFGRANLYRNDDGRFVDVAPQAGGASASWGDYDLDGDADLYVTRPSSAAGSRIAHEPGNSLLANQGDGTFRDVGEDAGVRAGRWGWGAKFIDLNNDGLDDLVVRNGFLTGAIADDLSSFFWRNVAPQEGSRYLQGWAALARLIDEGRSWSGHERGSCFANLGDGTFADASFASGLDFLDDGRAVAAVDWDGDGDLDLWLKNRTGPQLRFMRNDHGGGEHFLGLRLEGTLANRDAIGAQVDVQAGGRRFVRSVAAGDGYLSQSSKRLHFGLGDAGIVDRVTIRWPGGEEERFGSLAVDRDYRIRQGSGAAVARMRREVRLPAAPAEARTAVGPSRVLLRVPLPLPPTLARAIYGEAEPQRAAWIDLGVRDERLAARYPELRDSGVDVITLRAADMDAIDVILQHVLHRQGERPLPTSLLVDRQGRLQMVYLGPLDVDRLLADAASYAVSSDVKAERRSLWRGRWYFRTPRALTDLASDFKRRGLREDARFYVTLAQFAEEAGR